MEENEYQDRSTRLWGQEAFSKLRGARVCVLGLGGVGSFVVSSLARGGIGNLFLVDGDSVDPTNLNRQAFAFIDTVGQRKTDIASNFVSQVSPDCAVQTLDEFVCKDNFEDVASKIKNFEPDWVVDAIDSISTKLLLAERFCAGSDNKDVQFISATGAANKTDFSALKISDIFETSCDPICKTLRKEARQRGIKSWRVCWSDEVVKFAPEAAITRTGDKKILGSTSFLPAIMGHMIAGHVMNEITGRLS